MAEQEGVHLSDPKQAPDDRFEPGRLEHLVVGNQGRMLDPRRTPIVVRAVDPEWARWEAQVLAFEDAGARWTIDAEDVGHFQFARGAASTDAGTLATLRTAVERFDRPLEIPVVPAVRRRTEVRIAAEERRAREAIGEACDLETRSGRGDPVMRQLLAAHLARRDAVELDRRFAEAYASNPGSGELVKGHRIVIARLGLAPYAGKVPRDPGIFADDLGEARRAAHIVARLGFVRAMFRVSGREAVWLYRGLTAETPLRVHDPRTFVSATFDRAVALSLATRGPAAVVSALYEQLVPVDRLFMTYIETAALDRVYHEAEALLLADPANGAF